jgi:hypothetical protein
LERGRLHDGQFFWLRALEDTVSIGRAKHAPNTGVGSACHRRSSAYGKLQG